MRRVLVVGLLLAALIGSGLAPAAAAPGHRAQVVPCSRGLVALTFDDGPAPDVTPRLVRLLRRLDVPATFFMVGNRVAAYPQLARLVERNGFPIGNHTWAHTDLTTQTDAEIRQAMRSTRRAMLAAGLHPTELARPPYGATNQRVERVLTGLGYTSVLWTIDSLDWTGRTPEQIRVGIGSAVRPHRTNLVLQHDGVTNSPATLRALPEEIAGLRRRGYCFAGLDDAGTPTPPVPTPSLSTSARRVDEGERVTVTVRLDRPTSRPTTVRVEGWTDAWAHTVRFPVGRTVERFRVRVPQDRVDEAAERRVLRAGTATATVTVRDDDPAPVVTLVDGTATASPLLRIRASVGVRLDRPSDRDVTVVAISRMGPATAVVPAGSRTAELGFTLPVERPTDPQVDEPVRIVRVTNAAAGDGAILTVRPPDQNRTEAARAALSQVTWPTLRLTPVF